MSAADPYDGGRQGELRARAAWIALAGVVPLTLFVQWSDIVVGGTMVAGPFPPLAACLLWALLLVINALSAQAGHGRSLLTRRELLVVLAIWLAANMVAGRGLLHPLLASLAGLTFYARSPLISSAISNHIPEWFAVTDKAAARAFYEGHSARVPWRLWLRPLHPLGYALTGTLQIGYANKMLFSIFAGWGLKMLTLRFGGARGFRYLRGAAFGLILGDLLMGGVIKALDALLGPSGYAIF